MGVMSRIDDRVLGNRGIGVVSAAVSVLLLAATVAGIVNDHPFLSALTAVTGVWTGFWAVVRLRPANDSGV